MISIEKHLPEGAQLGTVLHIGAGDGSNIDSFLALRPQRLVLVEGDPITSAALEKRAESIPSVSIITKPVSAAGGSLGWHRFNLAFLNGPLVPVGLSAVYPRLRPAETVSVESIAISQLVESLDIDQEKSEVNVLVLDVPGQESALLAALPQNLLSNFSAVVLRSYRPGTFADAGSIDVVSEELKHRYYRAVASNNDEPIWPQVVLRFDAIGFERDLFRSKLEDLEARHAESGRAHKLAVEQLARNADELRAQLRELQQSTASAENLAQARANEIEILKRERDESVSLAQNLLKSDRELQARLAQDNAVMAADREAFERALSDLRSEVRKTQEAKAEAEKLATQRQVQSEQWANDREALERALSDLRSELRKTQEAKGEFEKLATQRQLQSEQWAKDKALLVAARDEQTKLAAERLRTIDRLERETTELTARHSMLREELVKSEAHVELIADLLLAEARL